MRRALTTFNLIFFCFIGTLYAHNNFELALSTNFPYKKFNDYARKGIGLQFNIISDSLLSKKKNIPLVSSIQFSRFGGKKIETFIGNDIIKMESVEKLLSFSIGPRFTIKKQFFIGFSFSQNLFYNRVKSRAKWVDTDIGECDDQDQITGDCEPDYLSAFFWDLYINLIRESISVIGSEIVGVFTSKNFFSGYKINAGIVINKAIFEISYHTMPNLKYPILTNDQNNLLEFIDADYLTVNITIPI